MRLVIGSGWWCSEAPDTDVNPRRKKLGDDTVRAVAFFETWLDSIRHVATPDEIVVVDSASPSKPAAALRAGVRWIELPFNARHSTDHLGRWSGWLRSVLASGHYAICAEAEYFAYVEQDCLLAGPGVIDHCIDRMRTGLAFGSGEGTPQPLQQSFFIVRQDRLPAFLKNLVDLKDRDCALSPEWKFLFASWRPLVIAANLGLLRSRRMRRIASFLARRHFDVLPVRGGRTRPLRVEDQFYYFQHGTKDELAQYVARREAETS
jgi:hypothetical protein